MVIRFLKHYFSLLFFLSLSLPHPSPARTLPASPTVVTATQNTHEDISHVNTTWHDFTRLLDAGKGSQLSGISDLKRYFHRFGYITAAGGAPANFTDMFDTELESAIILYQRSLGLPVTGELDPDTVTLITSPRCGVSDVSVTDDGGTTAPPIGTRRYAYFQGKPRWSRDSPVTLSYAFSRDNMISYLSASDVRKVFKRAFSRWAEVIPVRFRETEDHSSADIRIGFYRGGHGDGEPFDGVLGVLGHAFAPENGRFHLDAAETWAVDFEKVKSRVAIDLESVVTHEIGHVLGMGHSSVKEAVMYPSLSPRVRKVELRIDDVEGVQALYGSNPNFSLSSLLESEIFSNEGRRRRPSVSRCLVFNLMVVSLALFLGA